MAVPPSRGLFAGAGAREDTGKQELFLQVKRLTVPLLDASRGPPGASTTRTTVDLLEQLRTLLDNPNAQPFSPALANYVFFPLSSLLQPRPDGLDRGDRVLEATMQTLSALIPRWRAAGMEPRVRQELWIMAALTLGGPLDPNKPQALNKGKGKAVERSEETKLAMVEVLLALMKPDEAERTVGEDDDDDPLGERIDWSAPDPATAPPKPPFSPPPVPILFHTLTTLLALAAEPTSLLQLQLTSLDALGVLLFDYLARPVPPASLPSIPPDAGPSPLLATALPGTASTLSRIALSKPRSPTDAEMTTRRQASAVIVCALRTLSNVIIEAIGDSVTSSLRAEQRDSSDGLAVTATLEELVEMKLDEAPMEVDEDNANDAPPPAPPDPPPAAPNGPTIPTAAWLRYTLASLSTLFAALSPLSTHESPLVRAALVDLLAGVVQNCVLTLGEHAATPLEGLLSLASDEWADVRAPARQALLAACKHPPAVSTGAAEGAGQHPLALAADIVQRRLAALPRAIRRQDEDAVQRGAGIVRAALEVLPFIQQPAGGSGGALHRLERWSWGLLDALELDRVPGAGRAGGEGGMALAWTTGSGDGGTAGQATSFPPVRLRNVGEQATVGALEALWASLGKAAAVAGQEGEVVDLFLGVALGPRQAEAVAPAALWVLDGVLSGMKASEGGKVQRKVLKRAVKAVLSLLEELEVVDEGDDAPTMEVDEPKTELLAPGENAPVVGLIEHKKGVIATPSLDKYQPVAAAATSRETRASQILLLSSLSLRLLATLATLLASSFQPFLMQALYHVLAQLSPTTHPFLRAHAQHALVLLSDATSYASPQNLVLSNVDYVVNSVSQRLSVSRLEPSAPLVLVEMIRLVGKPIVPMVQDLVDDVFEALDDFHGYEQITVGLWAVLDALLKVMEEDLPERRAERKTDVVMADAEEDWRAFEQWFAHRHDKPEGDDEEELEEINPQRPFESGFADNKDAPDGPAEFPPQEEESKVAPPTRPQVVTAQILAKALYFLSHPSPFLRARVLSLIASAVPLLARPSLDAEDPKATRAADLLPVIHRAWPFILNRLADSEPYVVVEAAGLVEALAAHVGDFMSRQILDDVWPRFRTLLGKQEAAEKKRDSALGGLKYSTSFRLYRSVLRTLVHVARDVPLKEEVLWEQAVLLRRFLAVKDVEPELQVSAMELFQALGKVNADAVWLVLAATVAKDETLPKWLRMGGVDFGTNVVRVLDGL
ncbi:hypothetical protein JCM10213v2_002650 [Rhodosporidiobolus nylandii]